jgi:hypothetical protein
MWPGSKAHTSARGRGRYGTASERGVAGPWAGCGTGPKHFPGSIFIFFFSLLLFFFCFSYFFVTFA